MSQRSDHRPSVVSVSSRLARFGWTLSTAALLLAGGVQAREFVVTSSGDQGDSNPGNGFCAAELPTCTGICPSACTLRAAVEEANAYPGADRILIGAGSLVVDTSDLEITDDVEIEGAGAWSTELVGGPEGVFEILGAATHVAIRDLTIRDSGGSSRGGAIRSQGDLTVERVWFDGNTAGTNGCGALWNQGVVSIIDSTFTDNSTSSTSEGGALCQTAGGSMVLTNTTFVGNAAGDGGALFLHGVTSSLELYSSTLVDNVDTSNDSSPRSSAIYVHSGSLRLDKSLIVGDCAARRILSTEPVEITVTSNGGNLESPGSTCLLEVTGDQVDVPRSQLYLGDLADWGGPVPTILPGLQSPAVDPPPSAAGCPPFDARGEPRETHCGVGAVERQPDDPESGPFFADGFESGDVLAWGLAVP